MIKIENINGQVSASLYKKINDLAKLSKTDDDASGALNESADNYIGQEFYRMVWSKVSMAIPDIKATKSQDNQTQDIIFQPISISSYMNSNTDSDILGSSEEFTNRTDKQSISFNQPLSSLNNNRFKGHSGITKISATQQEFYTYQYTIDWECPDPIYFEKVFEPAFLKFGATAAIEFGYGRETSGEMPTPLTVDMIRKLMISGIRERNLISPANYFCAVGTVTKFDWKIREDGGYSGNLIIVSGGVNPLSDGSEEPNDESNRFLDARIENSIRLDRASRELLEGTMDNPDTKDKVEGINEEQAQEVVNITTENSSEVKKLMEAGVSFKSVVKNLDKVIDKWFELKNIQEKKTPDDKTNVYYQFPELAGRSNLRWKKENEEDKGWTGKQAAQWEQAHWLSKIGSLWGAFEADNKSSESPIIKYRFADGAFYFNWMVGQVFGVGQEWEDKEMAEFNDGYLDNAKLQKRYFMSWGFFEDIILNSFFQLKVGDDLIQQFRSINGSDKKENPCIKSDYLYTLGLDSVILPGKTHPLLMNSLDNLEPNDSIFVRTQYSNNHLANLDIIRTIYKLIDSEFNSFESQVEDVRYDRGPNNEEIQQNSKGQYYYIEEKSGNAVIVKSSKMNVGIIRNMVFPIEKFQTHFENATTIRQALKNFWLDVSKQYGGYWRFALGQDQDEQGRIGISDLRVSPYNNKSIDDPTKQGGEQKEALTKQEERQTLVSNAFTFQLYDKNSIVKSFELNLDISEEAATLARYGKYRTKTNKTEFSSLSDLPTEAWNLLTESSIHSLKSKETLENYKKWKELSEKDLITNLKYPSDDGVGLSYKDSRSYKFPDGNNNVARTLGNFGIVWNSIEDIRKDLAEAFEKINSDFGTVYKGVGMYDKDGNMTTPFKKTMLTLLNTAKILNSGSLITSVDIPIPITISMTLDGIGGLKVGDIFKVDYLPKPYRENTYFVIQSINHTVGKSGWITNIDAYMQFNTKGYWEQNPKKIKAMSQQKLDKLFEFSNISPEELATSLGSSGTFKLEEYLRRVQEIIANVNVDVQKAYEYMEAPGLISKVGEPADANPKATGALESLGNRVRDIREVRKKLSGILDNMVKLTSNSAEDSQIKNIVTQISERIEEAILWIDDHLKEINYEQIKEDYSRKLAQQRPKKTEGVQVYYGPEYLDKMKNASPSEPAVVP